ncbi:hypothetical protein R1sor_002746 [Riccia sorocarpa]|uniref:Uncharacterized protein n=1 Tax=Riccia sorocarpa TaxID=122646 RepID=A0ABD3H5S6_9MARC
MAGHLERAREVAKCRRPAQQHKVKALQPTCPGQRTQGQLQRSIQARSLRSSPLEVYRRLPATRMWPPARFPYLRKRPGHNHSKAKRQAEVAAAHKSAGEEESAGEAPESPQWLPQDRSKKPRRTTSSVKTATLPTANAFAALEASDSEVEEAVISIGETQITGKSLDLNLTAQENSGLGGDTTTQLITAEGSSDTEGEENTSMDACYQVQEGQDGTTTDQTKGLEDEDVGMNPVAVEEVQNLDKSPRQSSLVQGKLWLNTSGNPEVHEGESPMPSPNPQIGTASGLSAQKLISKKGGTLKNQARSRGGAQKKK